MLLQFTQHVFLKTLFFPIRYFWLPCQILVDCTSKGLIPGSLFYSMVCVSILMSGYTVFITITFYYSLKSGSVIPLVLFFLSVAGAFVLYDFFFFAIQAGQSCLHSLNTWHIIPLHGYTTIHLFFLWKLRLVLFSSMAFLICHLGHICENLFRMFLTRMEIWDYLTTQRGIHQYLTYFIIF